MMNSRDKANYQQAKKLVEDLRRELQVKRAKISQTAPELVKYVNEHQRDDVLVNGFTSQKDNPFRPKSSFGLMALECLKQLYNEDLHSNVIYLGNLILTATERCSDYLTPCQRYQACVYYADSLYQNRSSKRAEAAYMKALAMRKNIDFPPQGIAAKSTVLTSIEARMTKNSQQQTSHYAGVQKQHHSPQFTPEADVKYNLHMCLVRQSKFKEAVGVLESIPGPDRTPKVNAALGHLYKRLNLTKAAAQAFKDLLVACPFALEAMMELLICTNGILPDELLSPPHPPSSTASSQSRDGSFDDSSLAPPTFDDGSIGTLAFGQLSQLNECLGGDWLIPWLNGQVATASRDYASGVKFFDQLDTGTHLANNPFILCHLATALYHMGDMNRACSVLQRVHTLEPLNVELMDVLASLLYHDRRIKELESLATKLMTSMPECRPSWVAMGYLARALKKPAKALYFAHKACGDARPNPYTEAMILKGQLLLDMKKLSEAALHFQEALQSNMHRHELYEGLVNCQLERNKIKEARSVAALCLKQTGHTARALTLYASVLSKDPSTLTEAQFMLEKAIRSSPNLLSAVYLLVNIYDKTKQYDKAVELLKRQTSLCASSKLHGMLGEILGKSTMYNQAMDSYRFALIMDPSDEASMTGLNDLAVNMVAATGSQNSTMTLLRPYTATSSSSATPSTSTVTPQTASSSHQTTDELYDLPFSAPGDVTVTTASAATPHHFSTATLMSTVSRRRMTGPEMTGGGGIDQHDTASLTAMLDETMDDAPMD